MFFPVASIWAHKTIEIATHRALTKLGHEVISVSCDEALAPSCPAFVEAGLDSNKPSNADNSRVCSICKSRSRVAQSITLTRGTNLRQLTNQSLPSGAGVEIGFDDDPNLWPMEKRAALYEILVNSKAINLDLNKEQVRLVRSSRANWIKTREMAQAIIEEEKPDLFLTGDPLYSINAGVWAACFDAGVRVATIGSSLNHLNSGNALSLFSSIEDQAMIAWSHGWEGVSSRRLSRGEIMQLGKSIRYSLSGKSPFVYSSAHRRVDKNDVLATFQFSPDNPVILVITTTNDERFAAKAVGKLPLLLGPRNFSSQLDFLREVIALAQQNSGLNFIIRLHPRLLPNKRDSALSPYLAEIQQLLVDLPANVGLNSPDQQLALSDVALASDCALNWTSTAGLDVLTLGVPVVSCEPLETYSYPPSLGLKLDRRLDLERVIMEALSEGKSLKFAVKAFRYKNYLANGLTLRISNFARRRTRISLFRALNWARLRGRLWLPAWLSFVIDYLDGSFFTIRKSDMARLEEFLTKPMGNLPLPGNFLSAGSSEKAELFAVRNALERAVGRKLDLAVE